MWQLTAGGSIKLCESDNHVSLSPHVRTVVRLLMLSVNYCNKNEFKKMLSARPFHSDQTKTSTTRPRPDQIEQDQEKLLQNAKTYNMYLKPLILPKNAD